MTDVKIGRVIVGDVKEDDRKTRPFYFKIVTLDLDGEQRLVDFRRHYLRDDADTDRSATITQLRSARRQERKRSKS